MRRLLTALIVIAIAASAWAQASRSLSLDEVTVTARRPLKDIGVVKTTIDSAALRENIALSMADVLAFNSSIYVKSYGRGTESTVSFRGTSAGHTKVTWNGMSVNSPMLGMTDFSTIPAFLVDDAAVYHGSAGINTTGGGLGGLVALSTTPAVDAPPGLEAQYIQGAGSFKTFDEAARISWNSGRWQLSTRIVAASSANNFSYTNYDKKENIYDETGNIIGSYHPRERNRNGAYRDLHVMQQAYYSAPGGNRLGLAAWWMSANRELPLLSTDYGNPSAVENRRREETLRAVASWDRVRSGLKTGVKAGVTHSWMAYDYARERVPGLMTPMTTSRSRLVTIFALADGEYSPTRNLYLTASVSLHQHLVNSRDRNVTTESGNTVTLGYKEARAEVGAAISAKWQINSVVAVSGVLREQAMGNDVSPLIPALFVDALLPRPLNLTIKGSVSRNYRFPSLNDLYFMPGGNPDLRSESGFTYDLGAAWTRAGHRCALTAEAGWFDSYINDWIMWLPTPKGYFTPMNVKDVRAYGIELTANLIAEPFRGWTVEINGSCSWTPSINRGEKLTEADASRGHQLPYVPRHAAAVTGRLVHGRWGFIYKWNFYSRRYTMTTADLSTSGSLPPYFMSNIALDYTLPTRRVDLQFKVAVNNLFNEKYMTVLSRPMPGINWEATVGIRFKSTNNE